jgi:TldD protein
MSAEGDDTASRVAESFRGFEGSWEVYASHTRRFELYLQGKRVETVRGPVEATGYGLRLFRSAQGTTGVGAHASTDLTPEGIREARATAESLIPESKFPATHVPLPSDRVRGEAGLEIVDRALWDRPDEQIEAYAEALAAAFAPERDVVLTFGAIRAVLEEVSVANSAGGESRFRSTTVDLESIVKAAGGAEGRPPGEYWTSGRTRRLDPATVRPQVETWSRHARAVRDAKPSPSGELPVILPVDVLDAVLPTVVASRLSGMARLQKMAPDEGTPIAHPSLSLYDDGLAPWAAGTRPVDGEGCRQRRTPLVEAGQLSSLLYDVLHAGAFDRASTGNGVRGVYPIPDSLGFRSSPVVAPTTLSFGTGHGGSDAELIEAVGDGLWVQEIGFPRPDPFTTAFGGEIRVGYRIRGGKLREPIRGGTVGGVVLAPPGSPSLLANLETMGSTATVAGMVRSAPVLVRTLSVAGDGTAGTS